jgi:phosphoribosylformylglycinamidine synthase
MVILLGRAPEALGASEYAGDGEFPRFDLDDEVRLSQVLRTLAARRLLRSAQDVSDGGLAVALAECAMIGSVGALLNVVDVSDVALFSEDQGRAVITCASDSVGAVLQIAAESGVSARVAGTTGGDRLTVGDGLNVSLAALRAAWEGQA